MGRFARLRLCTAVAGESRRSAYLSLCASAIYALGPEIYIADDLSRHQLKGSARVGSIRSGGVVIGPAPTGTRDIRMRAFTCCGSLPAAVPRSNAHCELRYCSLPLPTSYITFTSALIGHAIVSAPLTIYRYLLIADVQTFCTLCSASGLLYIRATCRSGSCT